MNSIWEWRRYGLLLAGLLMFVGCSPSAATKASGSPAAADAEKSRSSMNGSNAAVKSSLDALRAGEPPMTPASSPLKEIYFDFDRYDLRADARAVLKTNSEWLRANPSVQVQIEGHCDERGTTEYNLALGARRAQSAKDFLVNLGIPASRLSTISFGKEAQICRGHDEECWSKNRHDRFVGSDRPASRYFLDSGSVS